MKPTRYWLVNSGTTEDPFTSRLLDRLVADGERDVEHRRALERGCGDDLCPVAPRRRDRLAEGRRIHRGFWLGLAKEAREGIAPRVLRQGLRGLQQRRH